MYTAEASSLLRHLNPWRLAGALSDKELRVASRRRRTYALRVGYIVLLILYVLSTWYWIVRVPRGQLGAFGASRASVLSGYVAHRIIWLQFTASQLVAAVLLGSSMRDETRRGTLDVLLTTPITSVHVVAGKLLAGLLQIVLLPAIGLPVLAILRLFGGLPWDLALATFCITLTAAVFAGALCLWLSTYYRRSHEAISAAAVVYLLVFVVAPLVLAASASAGAINPVTARSLIDLTNPFRALSAAMPDLWRAPAPGPGYFFSWPSHCLIMIGVGLLVLYAATRRIRRTALEPVPRRSVLYRPIRRLRGAPIVFRDLPGGLLRWDKRDLLVGMVGVILCGLLLLGKAIDAAQVSRVARQAQASRLMIYWYYLMRGLWMLVFIRVAIAAAGGVAREKEGGTWPLLLTTPLSERHIVTGKAIAALRRCGPLFFAALGVQTAAVLIEGSELKGLIVLLYALSRLASVFFLVAAGLYFGVRFRSTAVATAVTLGAFLVLNYLLGGSYNPLIGALMQKVITATRGRPTRGMSLPRSARLSFLTSSLVCSCCDGRVRTCDGLSSERVSA
jgi:ABC-type transport system involved in multi-copper enzyme maturation permease subunit